MMTELRVPGYAGADHSTASPTPGAHREQIVRRLLARGLSAHALSVLLPDFSPIVRRITGRE